MTVEPRTWGEAVQRVLDAFNFVRPTTEATIDWAVRCAEFVTIWGTPPYEAWGAYAYWSTSMEDVEIVRILEDKQRKYGPGNILAFGHEGIRVRLSDKFQRLINCAENDVMDDEHPIFDILGYCVVGEMLNRGWFGLPLATATFDFSSDADVHSVVAFAKPDIDTRLDQIQDALRVALSDLELIKRKVGL